MRHLLNFYDLRLMSLITFLTIIAAQNQILPTLARPLINTRVNIDFNSTAMEKIGSILSLSSASIGVGTTVTTSTTFTESSLYSNSQKIPITRSIISNGVIDEGKASTSTMGSTNSNFSISSSTTKLNSFTSTSKLPFDYTLNKKWTSSDAISFRASSPMVPETSMAATLADRSRTFRNKHHHEHHWGPFFEEPLNSTASGENVVSTAHLYTEAVLNCRVGMLKDKTVMWVRRTTEKVSLLTVGNITYSGDPRIRVKFQYPNNWRLLINPTQREDAGVYMCQVSTHPPRVFTTNLTILEPPLRLIDEQEREVSDRYYKAGSTIDLYCQVSRSFLIKENIKIAKSLQPFEQNQTKGTPNKSQTGANRLGSGYNELVSTSNHSNAKISGLALEKQFSNMIFWTKDDEILPFTAIKRSSTSEKWLISRVSIPDAKLIDSGNYSCSIGKVFTAIVQVQVLTGELPAAVQHNAAPKLLRSVTALSNWLCCILLWLPSMLLRETYRLPLEMA
uniref:Ig-like domain-containing protein n=1 Tax=Bactrocera latifrons TaxID=174628 RepID=A0A0K8W2S9_BACLA